MVLELLQSLSEMQIVGELTVLSLLVGGIIMAGGVIIAKLQNYYFINIMHHHYPKILLKTLVN
jgi:hypothetical protein